MPQSWEGAQHPSAGFAWGAAMGRGKWWPGAEDVSPALMRSICSCHHPRGASAMPSAVLAGLGASCFYLRPRFLVITVACLEANWADCPPLSPRL